MAKCFLAKLDKIWQMAHFAGMAVKTMNISLHSQSVTEINGEVQAGHYSSASEFFRELYREWKARKADAAAREFHRLSAGIWERNTTPKEEAAILRAQRKVRAALQAERAKPANPKARRA
jgi:Arc/MetJ-type ribon-helix-helix transcriptional regulator